ncbi:MAG TPA: hypothetical protein VF670_07325 [Duganella sp.]|jgi:GH25 family lysozyme M1 (1,4-beta-N-acetylmuramidase)
MLSAIAVNVAGYKQQMGANCANSMSWKGWQQGRQAGMAEIITHFLKMCGGLSKPPKLFADGGAGGRAGAA